MAPGPKSTPTAGPAFSKEERAAMRETVREHRSRARSDPAESEREVLAKIAEMAPEDRTIAEKIHALVRTHAPGLAPRTWYGMPAYANASGQVICFFRDARKFKERYATLGFGEGARLDSGRMWATSFALTELTPAVEAEIASLLQRAVR